MQKMCPSAGTNTRSFRASTTFHTCICYLRCTLILQWSAHERDLRATSKSETRQAQNVHTQLCAHSCAHSDQTKPLTTYGELLAKVTTHTSKQHSGNYTHSCCHTIATQHLHVQALIQYILHILQQHEDNLNINKCTEFFATLSSESPSRWNWTTDKINALFLALGLWPCTTLWALRGPTWAESHVRAQQTN